MSDQSIQELYVSTKRRKKIATSILVVLISSLLIISAIPEEEPSSFEILLPNYGPVSDFTLTNVNNESYSFSNDADKIRVVNFFYTKCPGDEGCSLITLKLSELFARVRQNTLLNQIKFISIDFDYMNDTVDDLREYALRYTADTDNWKFLWGNQTEIESVTDNFDYYFAVNNITATPQLSHDDGVEDPYDHTLIVYIIDQNSNIRKFLIGTFWTVDEVMQSFNKLLDEITETSL